MKLYSIEENFNWIQKWGRIFCVLFLVFSVCYFGLCFINHLDFVDSVSFFGIGFGVFMLFMNLFMRCPRCNSGMSLQGAVCASCGLAKKTQDSSLVAQKPNLNRTVVAERIQSYKKGTVWVRLSFIPVLLCAFYLYLFLRTPSMNRMISSILFGVCGVLSVVAALRFMWRILLCPYCHHRFYSSEERRNNRSVLWQLEHSAYCPHCGEPLGEYQRAVFEQLQK